MSMKMTRPVYDIHAVKRILQRRLPIDAVEQIAQVGVTVQEDSQYVMKRGDVNGRPVHVVLLKPNTVKTVYIANEWESSITVRRKRKHTL
jgi:hypothetical protein